MYVNTRWARRSLAGDVKHLKRWVRDMANSVGACTGNINPPSGSDTPDDPSADPDELFTDAETVKDGLWVAYLATNDEYSLINLINSVRELYPGADVIEVHQSDISSGKSYRSRESMKLTTYGIVEDELDPRLYTVMEKANLTPYMNETRGVKSRVYSVKNPTAPGSQKATEDDDNFVGIYTDNNPSTTNNDDEDDGDGCGGRGIVARRSIMARDNEGDDTLIDNNMMYMSMGISVTVKIGGVETKKTLKAWLKDTEDYIENNCKNFMDVRKLFDFFSTQPEESVETATNVAPESVEPDRVSMPIGTTDIMIAGAKLSNDPAKPLNAIYPTYIIREIPQFTKLNGSRSYLYTITKLSNELRSDLLSRTRFGLMNYKDDIYYMQSQISQRDIPTADTVINADDIKTALSNTVFDLSVDIDKAHFYRLHSTAISINAKKQNTHGIPPLMHLCMYDVKCYDKSDVDEGYVTIDLTRNSPVKDNDVDSYTPYTTASIIAKFTRDANNNEYAEGKILYYLLPIHISKVSNDYNTFAGNYCPYTLVVENDDGVETNLIQIYQCYAAVDQDLIIKLPVRRADDNGDNCIKAIINDMKNAVNSTPNIVTDHGVRILSPDKLEVAYDLFISNSGKNEANLDDWRNPGEDRDIKIPLADNEFIVHYGLAFGITGSVLGLPDASDVPISIDFLTNIDKYSKFTNALEKYGNGNGKFFMFSMSPYILTHGNPDVIMVLVIESSIISGNTTITANMYLCTDIADRYDDPDLEPQYKEPLLTDKNFDYMLSFIGNPFPLTVRIIRDICEGNITSKRGIQFTLADALKASSKGIAFYKYLNDMILNYKTTEEDSGWDNGITGLSTNLLNTRWYAGQYIPTGPRSIRRKRGGRTNHGLLVL